MAGRDDGNNGRTGDTRADGPMPRTGPTMPRTGPSVRTTPPPLDRWASHDQPTVRVPRTKPNNPSSRASSLLRLVAVPFSWLGWVLVVTVPLVLLAGGLVYVKLLFGSIPLHVVVEPIRQALMSELDGVDVGVTDAALHLAPSGAVELRLKQLTLASSRDGAVVRASEAVVDVDLAALWTGRVAASRIVLVGPQLSLNPRSASGRDFSLPQFSQPETSRGEATRGGASRDAAARRTAGPTPGTTNATTADLAAADVAAAPGDGVYRIELARMLAEAVKHLRRGGESASHLRAFGLRNASLVVADAQARVVWTIPELEIAVDHRSKRSVVTGQGRVTASGEPFSVAFRLEDSEKDRTLQLQASVEGLRPATIGRSLPSLAMLSGLDVPVAATGVLDLTSTGEVLGGRIDIDMGAGRLRLDPTHEPTSSGGQGSRVDIESGKLVLLYKEGGQRLELAPSLVRFEGGWVRLQGAMQPLAATRGGDGAAAASDGALELSLDAVEGALQLYRNGPTSPIEKFAIRAVHTPKSGTTEVRALVFKAAGAHVDANGHFSGNDGNGSRLEGRIGPIDLTALVALWPAGLAPGMRDVVSRSLVKGQLAGGTFRYGPVAEAAASPGRSAEPGPVAAQSISAVPKSRLTAALETVDLAIAMAQGLPPLIVPRALATLTGNTLEIALPEMHVTASAGRKVVVRSGLVMVAGLDQPRPMVDVSGRAQASLAALAELAGRDSVGLLKPGQVPPGTDGKVEAQWTATMPAADRIEPGDVKFEAKVRITDGRVPDVFGRHDVTGATFNIAATDKTIEIKGEMLLAGILAKAAGQWMVGEARERQSPIVLTTRLDSADRRQLGLAIEEFVEGDVPLEVHFTPGIEEHSRVQVMADLTGAELNLDGLAWRKPAGRTARLGFEVVKRGGKVLELQDFKISGEGIAIDGTVVIGADGQPQSYRFPGFSLNVVSNLEVEGMRGANGVWELKARGKTFDGGALMRSLYALDTSGKKRRPSEGAFDLDAQIDTVLGVNDTAVRSVRVRMRRQGDDIVGLELKGVLDGNHPIEALLRSAPGQPRIVHVNTTDAGQALRMIGFYPSMLGGKGELRINLDGRGAAERSGQMQVTRFRVLGDPVVSELVQGADDSRPAIATGSQRGVRRVSRQEIQFDHLVTSFATGNGQVALESLAASGPLVGASVRGKMDFRTQSVSVGGTYVPLSGLNRALAGIPLFGELLTGPRGDGIFGITFAVEGPMANPNVIINPLSLVAPGVLREIFQMVPDNPTVTPAAGAARPKTGGGPRVRSSEPNTGAATRPPNSTVAPRVIDGWSSQSTRAKGSP